jgi:hypothetical protein
MNKRSNLGLALISLALTMGALGGPTTAWAQREGATGQKASRKKVPQPFQTGLLVRMVIGLKGIVKVGDDLEIYKKSLKLVARANQACARVLDGTGTTEQKKKRLRVAHQTALRGIKELLPAETWKKVVATGDMPKSSELLQKIKVLGLGADDDPWPGVSQLSVGDDPFGFIGETEKNLARAAPLGGDGLLIDIYLPGS